MERLNAFSPASLVPIKNLRIITGDILILRHCPDIIPIGRLFNQGDWLPIMNTKGIGNPPHQLARIIIIYGHHIVIVWSLPSRGPAH